jgi:hypothetical protein
MIDNTDQTLMLGAMGIHFVVKQAFAVDEFGFAALQIYICGAEQKSHS